MQRQGGTGKTPSSTAPPEGRGAAAYATPPRGRDQPRRTRGFQPGPSPERTRIRIRATGAALLVAHLAFVAWLTLRPLDVPWVMPPNLHPLAGIRADLALGRPEAARRIGEGLALLAPLGVLLPMAHGRLWVVPFASFVRTVAAGALVSAGILLLQTGVPGRVPDVDSLLMNTVGVALAHLAVVPAARSWLRRRSERREGAAVRQEEAVQGRTPTFPRVGIAP